MKICGRPEGPPFFALFRANNLAMISGGKTMKRRLGRLPIEFRGLTKRAFASDAAKQWRFCAVFIWNPYNMGGCEIRNPKFE